MKASEFITEKTRLDPKCWDGYKIGKPKTKKGKKGERVNNCIPEDGIITKQNTTADVKPGETQRQAKKLGMTLDKKNRPPLLHKKAVKNSSPNTLFNLGLIEDKAGERIPYVKKLGYRDRITDIIDNQEVNEDLLNEGFWDSVKKAVVGGLISLSALGVSGLEAKEIQNMSPAEIQNELQDRLSPSEYQKFVGGVLSDLRKVNWGNKKDKVEPVKKAKSYSSQELLDMGLGYNQKQADYISKMPYSSQNLLITTKKASLEKAKAEPVKKAKVEPVKKAQVKWEKPSAEFENNIASVIKMNVRPWMRQLGYDTNIGGSREGKSLLSDRIKDMPKGNGYWHFQIEVENKYGKDELVPVIVGFGNYKINALKIDGISYNDSVKPLNADIRVMPGMEK